MEEREAIARMQRGDIGGLATLVRTYQLQAVRAAFLIVRDRDLAEEVVQAAFLRVYERIGQFDARRPFGPWFLQSVVHDAVKVAVRRGRQVPLGHAAAIPTDHPPDRGATPEMLWERAETRAEVWAALGTLPPRQRSVIVQRYYLGLTEAEMAGAQHCPTGTVKSRLHGARERLRLLLRPTACD